MPPPTLFRTPCIAVYAQVRITGFDAACASVSTMNLYDAARGLPLTGFAYRQETGGSDSPGFRRFRAAQGLDFAPRWTATSTSDGRACVSDAGEPPPAGGISFEWNSRTRTAACSTYRDTESFEFLPDALGPAVRASLLSICKEMQEAAARSPNGPSRALASPDHGRRGRPARRTLGARRGRPRSRDRRAPGGAALEGDVLRQDRRALRADDGQGIALVPACCPAAGHG